MRSHLAEHSTQAEPLPLGAGMAVTQDAPRVPAPQQPFPQMAISLRSMSISMWITKQQPTTHALILVRQLALRAVPIVVISCSTAAFIPTATLPAAVHGL